MDTEYKTQTGWLCLDFANTVGWHASDHPEEKLNGYADLVAWGEKAGLLTTEQAAELVKLARKEPAKAGAALAGAKKLREAVYGVVKAQACCEAVVADELATINRAAADLHARSRLAVKDGGFTWEIVAGENDLDGFLWPVVQSVIDLLTADDLARVGQCADEDGCGWLFWDTSRNRSRRWCDMGDCGNRAKVRRYYSRNKKQN